MFCQVFVVLLNHGFSLGTVVLNLYDSHKVDNCEDISLHVYFWCVVLEKTLCQNPCYKCHNVGYVLCLHHGHFVISEVWLLCFSCATNFTNTQLLTLFSRDLRRRIRYSARARNGFMNHRSLRMPGTLALSFIADISDLVTGCLPGDKITIGTYWIMNSKRIWGLCINLCENGYWDCDEIMGLQGLRWNLEDYDTRLLLNHWIMMKSCVKCTCVNKSFYISLSILVPPIFPSGSIWI